VVDNFLTSHDLSVVVQITSGRRCKHIYRVRDRTGRILILKMAEDDEGKEEIRRNLEGYKKLVFLGLAYFIPTIMSSSLDDKKGHILMEDCGTDFATLLREGGADLVPYERFEMEITKAYATSVGNGPDSNKHIDSQIQTVQDLYRDFFQTAFGSQESNAVIENLREFLPRNLSRFCFSSWDFMPGNIFIGDAGIKFADPTESVTGVPIIDLACLGGALGDVYNYPQASKWLDRLKRFSLGPLAEMLGLTEEEAEKIYLLGRLAQTLLSMRFSIQQHPAGNPVFVSRVVEYTKQLFLLNGQS